MNSVFIRRLSIRNKMILIMMAIAVISMLLMGFLLAAYALEVERQIFHEKYGVLARMTASRSSAAVVFNDASLAEENIAALSGDADIVGACIFDVLGEIIAGSFRDGANCPPYQVEMRSFVSRDYLHVYAPIVLDNETVGAVYLRAQLTRLSNALATVLFVMTVVFIAITTLAYNVASRLQHIVSGPILNLAAMVQRASDRRDYSERMEKQSDDEVGTLVTNVNIMLDTISSQKIDLEATKENLESLVARRTQELLRANDDLKSFSYSVSHDLRAPLRAISGFSAALAEDHGEKLDSDAHYLLRRVQDSAAHMGELIDALLSLSQLSNKNLVISEVGDLSALARECVMELQDADPQRKVAVAIEEGMTARGDHALLGALYANLVGNAWKYTGKVEKPLIEIGSMIDGQTRIFFVRDNGTGFDMQQASKLFDAFQRLHTKDEFDGIGIGLATVSRIVKKHGGKVWAESAPNAGATFYFTLGTQYPTV